MKRHLYQGVAAAALLIPTAATAQSTGTMDFENAIIVTGARVNEGVAGVVVPDTSKAKGVLTQDLIAKQRPGDSILNTINSLPGVSFQSNDPYGSSGGTLNIRGFSADRISLTVDGIPLNDTGNYAVYSNQQLDPELIEQVNVNLGSTDVDSPTASATGSTVNYRTRNPSEDFHATLAGSVGQYDYFRIFGVIDTGTFTPIGTRAFVSVSHAENVNPFNRNSSVDKWQYNAKLYQPIGDNGDFISIAANYNNNNNSNFSSIPLRTDTTQSATNSAPRVVGSASSNRFPLTRDERDYTPASCQTDTPQAGVADVPNSCGTLFDYSFNPSRTGNVRASSRFTLADGLVLTVDPSFQFVKANGGNSAVLGYEYNPSSQPFPGYVGGKPYVTGIDLNGDGDKLDQVELYAPSLTRTHRIVVLASLRYDISDTQSVRVNYTYDHGRHRQTGEVGYLRPNGYAVSVFPDMNPILDANGNPLEKRNRLSYAILNQVSGEYRGSFLDNRLVVTAGIRAPFFKRDLTNYCVTEDGGNGFIDCFGDAATQTAFLAAHPTYAPPQNRVFHYNKVLPNAGFVFHVTDKASLFANYSKGLQVPGTDNLYNSFSFPVGTADARPSPETSDNFDLGVRYSSSRIQAQLSGWYTLYKNRLASAYDPVLDKTIYRNLGTVDKYGVDGSIAYQPIPEFSLYAFGSYLKSKIKDNVQTGTVGGVPTYALTAGKRESGAPVYLFGARAQGNFGPVEIGIQAKRTGPRYINDQNLPVTTGGRIVYGAKTPAYTVVDLDARFSLAALGASDRTYLQLNVTNLFDKLYVAGFSGNLDNTKVPFAYIGAPRTVSGSLVVGF